jgi:Cu-processing system permease protein
MIDMSNVQTITRKELRDALRNRWFLLFTITFGGLALGLSALAQPDISQLRLSGYGRTTASLINLVLLFIPLIGLTMGASNIAGERETGALDYFLSQPVTRSEVLLGKYLGLSAALTASLTLGFGVAGIVLAFQGQTTDGGGYLLTVVIACMLAMSMISLGFLVSAMTYKVATALGTALFLWLLLVFVGDLGIMGSAVAMKLPMATVFFLTVLNPLQLFRIASILVIQADLEVLGPVGLYATDQFGDNLLPILLLGLLIWIIIPLTCALLWFSHEKRISFSFFNR